MDTKVALTLARELMNQHGLQFWNLKLDSAKRRCGQCRYSTRTLSFSRGYLTLNSESDIRDTILHEIAHALVGPGHHHDAYWQGKAKSIGCNGMRCASEHVKMPEGRYHGICLDCGRRFEAHRKPNLTRTYSHTDCRRAGKVNRGRIEWRNSFGISLISGKPKNWLVATLDDFSLEVAAQNAPAVKPELSQTDINDMWERLNKLERKL